MDLLNKHDWNNMGEWIRQDPGFQDARFKDSITIFSQDNIDMALIAWLPENVIWGKPKIIDVLVVSGKSVAEA